jgi:hypothetical protein
MQLSGPSLSEDGNGKEVIVFFFLAGTHNKLQIKTTKKKRVNK